MSKVELQTLTQSSLERALSEEEMLYLANLRQSRDFQALLKALPLPQPRRWSMKQSNNGEILSHNTGVLDGHNALMAFLRGKTND